MLQHGPLLMTSKLEILLQKVDAGVATDDELADLRKARESAGATTFVVRDGRPIEATLFVHNSTVENVRLEAGGGSRTSSSMR